MVGSTETNRGSGWDVLQGGGDRTRGGSSLRALEAVRDLREAIAVLGLSNETTARAARAVDEMEDELRRLDPDRNVMASRVWRLTELLEESGAVVAEGTPLFGSIARIARWVGPIGESLIRRIA